MPRSPRSPAWSASTRRRRRCSSMRRPEAPGISPSGPMSATAALSAATVGEFATQGSGHFVAMTAALAIATGIAAGAAGVARLWFMANFNLRARPQGLHRRPRADDHRRPAARAVRRREGQRRLLRQLWDLGTSLGETSTTTLLVGARRRSPVVVCAALTVLTLVLLTGLLEDP